MGGIGLRRVRCVCLANSRMGDGRCIAVKEWNGQQFGRWIRPVRQNQYSWKRPKFDLLDVVYLPLIAWRPEHHHREDWECESLEEVRPLFQLGVERLSEMLDSERELWVEPSDERTGQLDRVPADRARRDDIDSLRLIRVERLRLEPRQAPNSSRKLRAIFAYYNHSYDLAVTDPWWEDAIERKPDLTKRDLGPRYLTISLGREYCGFCYKLVAAIIPREEGL